MASPPKEDTERAQAAQIALAESIERAWELVCEARFMLRPRETPEGKSTAEPPAPGLRSP